MMNQLRKISLVVVMSALALGYVSASGKVIQSNITKPKYFNEQAKIGYSGLMTQEIFAARVAKLASLLPRLDDKDTSVLNVTEIKNAEVKEEVRAEAPVEIDFVAPGLEAQVAFVDSASSVYAQCEPVVVESAVIPASQILVADDALNNAVEALVAASQAEIVHSELNAEEVSNIAATPAPQQSKCKRFVKAMIKPLIPVLVLFGATYVRVYLSRMNQEPLIPV